MATVEPSKTSPQDMPALPLGLESGLLKPISRDTAQAIKPIQWYVGDFILINYLARSQQFRIFHTVSGSVKDLGQSHALSKLAQRIPGAHFSPKVSGLWCPASMYSALVLHHAIPAKKYQSPLVYQHFCILLMQWQLYYSAAKKQADYRSAHELDTIAQSFPMPQGVNGNGNAVGIEATPYQRATAACAVTVPGYGMFLKQGTGKTFAAIMAMEHLARKFNERQQLLLMGGAYKPRAFRAIVVCPKSVCYNWEVELGKFTTGRGLVTYCKGDSSRRIHRMIDACTAKSALVSNKGYDWSVLIISHMLLARVIRTLKDFEIFDLAIFDESHRIKGPKNDITRAAHMLRDICTNRYALTGTPMPNNPGELWAQLEFMHAGLSGSGSANQFKKTCENLKELTADHFKAGLDGSTMRQFNLLQEKLIMSSFSITKEEALPDLPPKVYNVRGVDMTTEQTTMYKKVLSEVVVAVENEIDRGERQHIPQQMIMQNVLKRMLRLAQITSGFYVTDDICDDGGALLQKGELNRFDPNPKIEAVIEYIKEQDTDSKILLWCHWRQTIKTLSARLDYENIKHVTLHGGINSSAKRAEIMAAFNTDPSVKVMLGTSAGGTGVNLLGQAELVTFEQTGELSKEPYYMRADRVGIVDQDFNAVTREQQEDRNHRMGVKWTVEYTDFMVPNTIDQQIREVVVDKRLRSMTIQDVRNIINNLRAGDFDE